MEYKKKKNDAHDVDRDTLIGMGIRCVIGLFFLLLLLIVLNLRVCGCSRAVDYSFAQTARAIESMHNDLRILITDIAATEQYIMTSTARP